MTLLLTLLSTLLFATPETVDLKLSFDDAKARTEAFIKKSPMTLFTIIDHQAGAQKVGLTLNHELLFIFGNPKGGTLLMQQNPLSGFDLPLKVLLYTQKGQTKLAYLPPKTLQARYGLKHPVLNKIEGFYQKLIDHLQK